MSRVVTVPEEMDNRGFEELLVSLDEAFEEGSDRILLNAKHVRWVSPYGLIGLLAVGRVILDRTGNAPSIEAPESRDVRSYWDFMGFWQAAVGIFDVPSVPPRIFGPHDALLEITSIRSHRDVHSVVERVRERAASILEKRLHYPKAAVIQFSVMLSEVCQNIIEHSDADGWVCAQTYHYRERLGREVLMLAVMDVGVGFQGSLAAEHARRYGESWSSATALEAALLYGESRFRDPGRGQGLQAIRRQVDRWGGELAIRSGNAQIALVPDWDDLPPMQRDLPSFPGAQILIVMPARDESEGR
ncbi:MAG: ATP-binding protein [Gemmatimonadota bacterium]|nr:ATP-binding protein [Gemmatimonadota bacterium]MDH3428232.1 ATP-binding protein [Gemmatimonadota bacterium]